VQEGLDQLNISGYNFEDHLRFLGVAEDQIEAKVAEYRAFYANVERYLLFGVRQGMARLKELGTLVLVTYGFPTFQQMKLAGLGSFRQLFFEMHFVHTEQTKGDVVAEAGEPPRGTTVWILDDTPANLLDIERKAPRARLVRMMWSQFSPKAHEGDGELWEVVRSFAEFEKLVDSV
jgi:hypothetical protein